MCVSKVLTLEMGVRISSFSQENSCVKFLAARFRVIASGSSDFIARAALFSASILKLLCWIYFLLADILPSAAVSGWYFTQRNNLQ